MKESNYSFTDRCVNCTTFWSGESEAFDNFTSTNDPQSSLISESMHPSLIGSGRSSRMSSSILASGLSWSDHNSCARKDVFRNRKIRDRLRPYACAGARHFEPRFTNNAAQLLARRRDEFDIEPYPKSVFRCNQLP